MKPHPRARRFLKWTGAVACALSVAAAGWSVWNSVGWCSPRPAGIGVGVSDGQLRIVRVSAASVTPAQRAVDWTPGWSWTRHNHPKLRIGFGVHVQGGSGVLIVPLWAPALAGLAAAAAAWRFERVSRRREEAGECACGYDRRGIPAGEPCPECGCVEKST